MCKHPSSDKSTGIPEGILYFHESTDKGAVTVRIAGPLGFFSLMGEIIAPSFYHCETEIATAGILTHEKI